MTPNASFVINRRLTAFDTDDKTRIKTCKIILYEADFTATSRAESSVIFPIIQKLHQTNMHKTDVRNTVKCENIYYVMEIKETV